MIRPIVMLLKYTLLLFVGVLVLLPYGLKHGAVYYLETEKQLDANIGDVRFNLFTGQVGVSGVHLYGEKNGELHLDELLIDVSLLELINQRAVIEKIKFKNFRSNVTEQADGWNVGGLFFPLPTNVDEKKSESISDTESTPMTWGYGVRDIEISNIKLLVESQYTDSQVILDELNINDAYSWLPDTAMPFNVRLQLNSDVLSLTGEAKPFIDSPEVAVTLVVDNVRLQPWLKSVEMHPVQHLDAELFAQLDLTATLTPHDTQLKIDGAYGLKNISLNDDMRMYHLSKIQMKGEHNINVAENVEINVAAAMTIEQLAIHSRDKKIKILSLESWMVDGIKVQGVDNVQVAQVNLQKLEVLNAINVSQPAALLLDRLVVNDIRYQPNSLQIDRVELVELKGDVRLNEEGELVVLSAVLPKKSPTSPSTPVSSPEFAQSTDVDVSTDEDTKFSFSLNEFILNDNSRFHFVDKSVTPVFETEVHDLQLTVKNIDLLDVNKKVYVDTNVKIDEYATFFLQGNVQPFGEKVNATLVANLRDFELVPLSSYAAKFAGLNIQRGTLDFDANIHILNDELDVKNTFYLRQLMMESDDTEVSRSLFKDMPMPLNLTLDVLRDKKNVIKLDIPVKGDVNNPDFSLQDIYNHAMKKALKFAATHYLLQAVQPLGLAITAGKLLGKAMVPRFEPLVFEPGSSKISAVNTGHIEKLATVLLEKDKLSFTLCGTATESDWKVLQAQAIKSEAGVALKKEDRTKWLLKIANTRAKQVKKRFVEKYELSPSRLLSCNGKINKDEKDQPAIPAVDISL